ncbi:MAG: hypothetical protein V1826_01380 [bacterium]
MKAPMVFALGVHPPSWRCVMRHRRDGGSIGGASNATCGGATIHLQQHHAIVRC